MAVAIIGLHRSKPELHCLCRMAVSEMT